MPDYFQDDSMRESLQKIQDTLEQMLDILNRFYGIDIEKHIETVEKED
jgi:hypothetical protein